MSRRPQVEPTRFRIMGLMKGSWSWFETKAGYDSAERARKQWAKKYPGTRFVLEVEEERV